MTNVIFNDANNLPDEWLTYYGNEANNLSSQSEMDINHYMDRQFLNPEVKQLMSTNTLTLDFPNDTFRTLAVDSQLTINDAEERIMVSTGDTYRGVLDFFKRMKMKIKSVFCDVIGGIDWEKMNTQEIIKAVLIALIPTLAGGVGAVLMPVVVGLVALLIKKGYHAVCPI